MDVIQDGRVLYLISIILTLEFSMQGIFRVYWIKELFTLSDLVLANLDKTFTRVFCSLERCNISEILNFANFSLAMKTYHCSNNSLVWDLPFI